jgi:hypothetical protein
MTLLHSQKIYTIARGRFAPSVECLFEAASPSFLFAVINQFQVLRSSHMHTQHYYTGKHNTQATKERPHWNLLKERVLLWAACHGCSELGGDEPWVLNTIVQELRTLHYITKCC